ncbi:MAG: Brp/Blh family beta-carotene 15,15'-dioxygenase [Bacteroidota bacterium]
MKNIIIVLTFFGLWLSTQLPSVAQDYIAYAFILTFGVLHGANDITLITSLTKKKGSNKRLLLTYLGAVLLVTLLFMISKGLALIFFILISAYHFGEQHFSHHLKKDSAISPFLYALYGSVILFMIFSIKLNEVLIVIEDLSGWILDRNLFIGFLSIGALGTLMCCYKLIKDGILEINPVKELFYLAVLGITFANSSLVWGFAIYFIFWHSLPSMKDQLHFLYGRASGSNFMSYLKTSSLYWLVSILGLGLLYWLLKDSVDYFITVVLYVLAAITFPHVLVMSKIEAIRR